MLTPKDLALPALANAAALVVYVVFTVNVGRARGKYNVPAPQVSGNPDFERVVRVQQNTLEQLALFLPSLWMCAVLFSPLVAAGLGGAWTLARILYAWGYYSAAEKRGPGFGLTVLSSFALLICGVIGAVKSLIG